MRRPREQKEVAFGLCDLSTHEELHERIVKKGGVKSLLNLLTHSQDAEAQRFSALAIANCASAVFNRLPIVAEGTPQPLIDYIKDENSDLIGRQYCAMAIGNLAAGTRESRGSREARGHRRADDAAQDRGRGERPLLRVRALQPRREREPPAADRRRGRPAALVALACCEDINAQRQSLAALRGLCISPMYRPLVVREGILDPLVLMARTEEIEVLREVAAALNCLSSVEENKMEICDRSISTIIAMLLSGDTEVERHACCNIANLMEMAELHGRLLEERGLAPLVALALSDDLNTKGEASRAIANLAANADVQQVGARSPLLPP